MKKHVKRKANISEPSGDKRQKIEESSLDLEKSSAGRRVRLISESCEMVIKDILHLISEHSGSEELYKKSSVPNPRVGMSSGTVKSSHPKPKIADSRVYSYHKMIERQEELNDSDELKFDISHVEKVL